MLETYGISRLAHYGGSGDGYGSLPTDFEVVVGLSDAFSVRTPLNKDSPLKNSVLSSTKKSSEKVEVYVRTNKKTYVASKNIVSNKKIASNVEVQNALKAKKVRRAIFTTPRKVKFMFEDTTHVVSKIRFSVQTTQSKSLDTTPVVSRTKISAVTPISVRNKVPSAVKSILRGKSKKSSHLPKLVPSTHSKLELLHIDLCGPIRVATINRKKYILVTVDDYSRFTWVYFLHTKDETPKIIKKFIAQVQLNYNAKVYNIRTDNGTEFKNETLKAHYDKLDIMQQLLIACTPPQNGVVERRNRTLLEAARTMLIFSRLLEFL
nr:putative ribonuclease H-like domain-containing protein [Tanacetum cinerariifolium]